MNPSDNMSDIERLWQLERAFRRGAGTKMGGLLCAALAGIPAARVEVVRICGRNDSRAKATRAFVQGLLRMTRAGERRK